jgi:hypothetical protein
VGQQRNEAASGFSQLIAIGGSGELHMLTDFQRSDLKPVFQNKTAVVLVR